MSNELTPAHAKQARNPPGATQKEETMRDCAAPDVQCQAIAKYEVEGKWYCRIHGKVAEQRGAEAPEAGNDW